MAKKKKKKGKGLFKKALKAGALLALAPMLPAMIGMIAATVTTNPAAANALRKKLKKKKLKYVVQEFVSKVVKKKKNLEDLESTFDFDTLKSLQDFQGDVKHLQGSDTRSFEDMLQSALDASDNLHKDHMEDNFVQAVADIVKMVFSFFKGLKKKKDKGEKISPAEDVAIKESDVDEDKADEAVEHVRRKEGGFDAKTLLIVGGAILGGVVLFKAVSK